MKTLRDRYALLVEQSSDVVFSIDATGRFDWVSDTASRITGWPAGSLVGRPAQEVMPLVGVDDLSVINAALVAGESLTYHGRLRRADGTDRWTEVSISPRVGDDGQLLGAVGSARDVHDEVEARRMLVASESQYQLLAQNATDVVMRADPDRILRWVSPSVTATMGWLPEEVLGRSADDFLHPDDLAALEAERQRLYSRDHSEPMPARVVRILRKDGTYHWMSGRRTPLLDADGQLVAVVTGLTDVEDLVHNREAAQRDRERLRAILDTLADPHIVFDALRDEDGHLVDFLYSEVNTAAGVYNQKSGDELIGVRLTENVHGDFGRRLFEMYRSVLETGETLVLDDVVFPDRSRDMAERRFDLRAVKVGDAVSVTWRDVTERHVFEEGLAHVATHDPLTGLANRAALNDDLARALSAGRRSGRPTAVLMLDLDHFKFVNDTFGHAVGDELLKGAAGRLDHLVRAGDLVARLGGDEFVVVMRELDDPGEAYRAGVRIVEAFRSAIPVDDHDLLTTTSVGIAISTDLSSVDDLITEADVALYRAKDAGRDRTAIYNDALREAVNARVVLEEQLRPALDLGELVVHFQPEIDLHSGLVTGAEALLRWHHASGELYVADRFITLAEEAGLIIDIGNWVASEACQRAVSWIDELGGPLRTLYLNISKAQLGDAALVDSIDEVLGRTRLPASLLCLEVTERAMNNASSVVRRNLVRLRDLGVRMAIDNFGTGDAALAHLRDHHVDVVKIDRSFIRDVERDDNARRLVGGITALARTVGLVVVAEGVETAAQADFLRDAGCSGAHGFLFSGAVPADDFPALLARRFCTCSARR